MTRKQEDMWFLMFTGALLLVAALLLHGCAFSCTLAAQEPLPPLPKIQPMRADPIWDYSVPRNQ